MEKRIFEKKGPRIPFMDMARFYAMFLVFYGHFIESIMKLNDPAAMMHYRIINSFHMVLFIVIAGYVSRDSALEVSVFKFLKQRFVSRLLPFLFFTLVFMLLPVFLTGNFERLVLPSTQGYMIGSILTLFGLPVFCIPSWFILLIFSVEFVHYLFFRFIKSESAFFKHDSKILIAMVCFYVVGYLLNLKGDFFNPVKGRIIGWNYLFIHEAIFMYAFYLLGVYLRRRRFLLEKGSHSVMAFGVIIAALVVYFTYSLNTGPFSIDYYNSVVIIFSSHGHMFWFLMTTIAGSLLILFLAKITPAQNTIVWMGQNTLLLMILNGVFYHYINFRVADWFVTNFPSSQLNVLVFGIVMTILSLLLCMPLIYAFDKFTPQLVGKPKLRGPWIPNLV